MTTPRSTMLEAALEEYFLSHDEELVSAASAIELIKIGAKVGFKAAREREEAGINTNFPGQTLPKYPTAADFLKELEGE